MGGLFSLPDISHPSKSPLFYYGDTMKDDISKKDSFQVGGFDIKTVARFNGIKSDIIMCLNRPVKNDEFMNILIGCFISDGLNNTLSEADVDAFLAATNYKKDEEKSEE